MLDVLAGAHLIEPSRPGHYRPHALLRAYAGELAGADPEQPAVVRLAAHYLHTAARAMERLSANRLRLAGLAPSCAPTVPVPDLPAAVGWLAEEQANLAAVVRLVGQGGWPWRTVQLARTVGSYLETGSLPALPADRAVVELGVTS